MSNLLLTNPYDEILSSSILQVTICLHATLSLMTADGESKNDIIICDVKNDKNVLALNNCGHTTEKIAVDCQRNVQSVIIHFSRHGGLGSNSSTLLAS